ncbi:MAG: tetratricopeptide repeat protein, partial [Longimicrobiales bacterium]
SASPIVQSVRRRGSVALAASLAVAALLAACRSSETALQRGDRFWADSNYTAALAEYRLAASRNEGVATIQARVAHAYVLTGQLERGREEYDRLLKIAPEMRDQAVFDFLWLAHQAAARSDRFGLARAVESAVELRPGLDVGVWAPSLARYYATTGDADRALEYFERGLGVVPKEGEAHLLFEIAALHERQGDCEEATSYLRSYLHRVPYGDSATDARFRIGTCAFDQGRKAREEGKHSEAIQHFAAVITNGSPPNLVDQAWFEQGEALVAMGRPNEALESYRRVVELTGGRDTQTSIRARRRILEILTGALSR